MISITNIEQKHVTGFHDALDIVAKEKKYLAWIEAPPIDSTQRFVKENIANNIPQVVALDDDKVIGWCDIEPLPRATRKHTGTLGIGILPVYRNKGIGTKLIMATLERARGAGIEKVELEVLHTNVNAIGLYRKIGFQNEGRRLKAVKIDDTYYDCILMALFL